MPGTRVGGLTKTDSRKLAQVDRIVAQALDHQLPALLPGHHQREHERADQQREPAAVDDLDDVGGEEREVDDEEEAGRGDAQRPADSPSRSGRRRRSSSS